MSLVNILRDEKCKNAQCGDSDHLCVCAKQAGDLYDKAMEIAQNDCSFVSVRARKNCIHVEPYCQCRDRAREELKV